MYRCFALRFCKMALSFGAGLILLNSAAFAQQYTQINLVSDTGAGGTQTDANLKNGWGISRSSSSPWWVSDNVTGRSTLYAGDGTIRPLVVNVPGNPTGTIANPTVDFKVQDAPAAFLFVSVDGTLSAWNQALGTQAMVVVPNTHGAAYTGLAIAKFRGANYLYAADFHNGRVDVFDANFNLVRRGFGRGGEWNWDEFPFVAARLGLRGFAPFGIQAIGNTIFVTFAKQDANKQRDVPGPGNGFIAAFTAGGRLIYTLQPGPWLNSPWGVTLAPDDFGTFSHHLLIGQFGSGQIAAYDISSGAFTGLLHDASDKVLAIDGLWGIGFGNGAGSGPANALYFAAGPNQGSNGLFGVLTVTSTNPSTGNSN